MDKGSFKSEISMISYNGKLIPSESMTLDVSNRGFQYGDGIFETIISKKGEVKFQREHWERVEEGVSCLRMNMPFTKIAFIELQLELLKANDLTEEVARMKLYIWRKPGGLYTPKDQQTEFLLTAEKANDQTAQRLVKVGVAQRVHLHRTAFSHLKTISALPYVMAGIEKQERGLEELILLNDEGFIAEASAANIYFVDSHEKIIYTPSLDSGCINGVSRRYLLKEAAKHSLNVQEVMWKVENLAFRLSAFTINVAGIKSIQNIEGEKMGDSEEGLEMLERIFN